MAGSTKKYSYCVTGMEDKCVLPDELFPVEDMAHEIEEVVHELDEAVHVIEHEFQEIGKEIKHEFEVVVHDINVALHLEEEETENGTSQQEVNEKSSFEIEAKEEEEALTK
jgi:cell division protein ZapA (FtsZ GTPase activity inhibitor)